MNIDELTAFEQRACALDASLVNALAIAHIRSRGMLGLMDCDFKEFREEERAAFLEWFNGECVD